ncbi:hypothetical protein KJZ67_01840 [Patescibacteria group bacterium]|nr:hypothetical protein [Patescibacteria group bacterium]
MKGLESRQIEGFPQYTGGITTPYSWEEAPFSEECFGVEEVNWLTADDQTINGVDQSDRYTKYIDDTGRTILYKIADEFSSEPLAEPFASYMGNKWLGVPVARTTSMASRKSGRRVLGVVSPVSSWDNLAQYDDGSFGAIEDRIDTDYLQGDGVLRAWMRDNDHAGRHIVVRTGSDAMTHYYLIDHGRSFHNSGVQWNESALLDAPIGECFYDITPNMEKILEYVGLVRRIPDWLITAKCMEYALSIQRYDVPNKSFYLRRAHEMSQFLIKSKKTLKHDVMNAFSR